MIQRTENEVPKEIVKIKLEEDHHFIMGVEIFAHLIVMMIGLEILWIEPLTKLVED